MIKTILIEDELLVRSGLKKMIKIIAPEITIIEECDSVTQAIKLINTLHPDLIFLDIQLKDGSGFNILQKIDTSKLNIIFTTAYNQFAIKAFKYSAIDYLLKPIDPTDLNHAISKVIKNINHQNEFKHLVQILKNNIEKSDKKIVLKTTENRSVIPLNEIIYLKADGAYTVFHTQKDKIITSKNLKYYQDFLDANFIRCHHSYLVNSKHIKSIIKNSEIQLSNQDIIPISSRKKKEIIKIINKI